MLTERYVNKLNQSKLTFFSQKSLSIPDPQMYDCPAYHTREEFFTRHVTNNTSNYENIL